MQPRTWSLLPQGLTGPIKRRLYYLTLGRQQRAAAQIRYLFSTQHLQPPRLAWKRCRPLLCFYVEFDCTMQISINSERRWWQEPCMTDSHGWHLQQMNLTSQFSVFEVILEQLSPSSFRILILFFWLTDNCVKKTICLQLITLPTLSLCHRDSNSTWWPQCSRQKEQLYCCRTATTGWLQTLCCSN